MSAESLLHGLNEAQRKAVLHLDGPLLVVAGAGTGKTTVITKRIAHLICDCGINSEHIVALTFTDKAAREMNDRLDQLLPAGYTDLFIGTFHKFCERLLRSFGGHIGLNPDFKLLSETDSWIFFRNNIDSLNLKHFKPLSNPTRGIESLLKHFSRCKDENITAQLYTNHIEEIKLSADIKSFFELGDHFDDLSETDRSVLLTSTMDMYSEIAGAYMSYQNLLLQNNYLDFGDLLCYAFKLLNERPFVLNTCRKLYEYLVVDEFQDTNTIQYELIKLLSAPRNNLMIVGDDDQSIYKFRGASIKNIMKFPIDYPSTRLIALTENYRSVQKILDLAYTSISHNNPFRLEVRLCLNKKLISFVKDNGVIDRLIGATVEDEARLVVQKIIEIKKRDVNANWSDFVILGRAHGHLTPFSHELELQGIPFHQVAGQGLYIKPVIITMISYFRVLYNHHDSSAMFSLLSAPSWGLTHEDLVALTEYSGKKGLSLYDSLKQISLISGVGEEASIRFALLLSLFDGQRRFLNDGGKLQEMVVHFLYDSGYLDCLTKQSTFEKNTVSQYIDQFIKKIIAFEDRNPHATLKNFVDLLELELVAGETGSLSDEASDSRDCVSLMTIHSSKGLEFPYVFIVNMVEQRLPTQRKSDGIPFLKTLINVVATIDEPDEKSAHIQEERRLFYVALTRAKRELYLTSANSYGGTRTKKISIFLKELGYENVDILPNNNSFNKQTAFFRTHDEATSIKTPIKKFEKYSFTQLQTFDQCPQKYKYRYILNVPTRGNKSSSFGSSLHKTLEKFFKKAIEYRDTHDADLFNGEPKKTIIPSKDELFSFYESSWIDVWYESIKEQAEYKENGRVILSEFYNIFLEQKPYCYKIEQPFTLKFGEYTLAGRIDRIDKKDEAFEIIDYKSGTPKKNIEKSDKRQLSLYQLAAEQLFGIDSIKLTYYYLQKNSVLNFTLKQKDKDEMIQWVETTVSEINRSDYNATPGFHCSTCDFQRICPFKQ